MPPPAPVNDALWRCLCPSFKPFPSLRNLSRPLRVLIARNALSKLPSTPRSSLQLCQTRKYNSAANSQPTLSSSSVQFQPPRAADRNKRRARLNEERSSLVLLHTNDLYERLRSNGAAGQHEEVMNIIKILIKDRRERPNLRMYAAMLHSFVNSQEGTAGKIRKVLEEMAEVGVELDVGACHCVLEALAVHPDYVLRDEILEYMKERWFSLNEQGHNMVVAGMLRDRHFEQAVQKIDEMVRQHIMVYRWVWDKATWMLLDFGEVEDAWHLFQLRKQTPDKIKEPSPTLYGQLLDVASRLCHVEAVTTIWNTQVIPSYIKPGTETCLHILNLAARIGNVDLATDVFRVLGERKTVFNSHHYEMLLETYLNAKDLDAALSVVSIMAEAAIKVDENAIHPLYTYLREDPTAPLDAFERLRRLDSEGRKIPAAAINACLQASIHQENLEEAIEIYKAFHAITSSSRNTQTFNILFQGCHKAGRKELAMYLAAEMVEMNVSPDALTYDRLILVCCHADELTDAFSYYEEMRHSRYVPRRGCFEILIEKGVEAGDGRTPRVLEDMKSCGLRPKKELVKSVGNRFVNKTDEVVEVVEDERRGRDFSADQILGLEGRDGGNDNRRAGAWAS